MALGAMALAVSAVPATAQDAQRGAGPLVTPAIQVSDDIRPGRNHGYQQLLSARRTRKHLSSSSPTSRTPRGAAPSMSAWMAAGHG